MVVGLLALALAFFAVGQAGASRNGTQSGADAAALAAAQEARELFRDELVNGIADPDFLQKIFDGELFGSTAGGCAAAGSFAQKNGTTLDGCAPLGGDRWGYTVHVTAQEPLGDTILPGTDGWSAEATATAVVLPRCTFEAPDEEPPPEGGEGEEVEPDPSSSLPAEPILTGTLDCDGEEVELDPESLDSLPDMSELFTVRLAED